MERVRAALKAVADPSRSAAMSAYMRDQFPFLGVTAALRRQATRRFLSREAEWGLIFSLFDAPERELNYVGVDAVHRAHLSHADLPKLRQLVMTKPWWDTVDSLAKAVGSVATADDMREWAVDKHLWVRRAALLHQLGRAPDTELLAELIELNLGSGEFFIDKAIGWALRDAARHDPEWVRRYVAATDLAPLSRREALKHL